MASQGLFLPSGSGGLMRYNEEYKSSLMLTPTHIIVFLVIILAFVAVLKIFFPL